ncbi:MAG: hypothetical protein PHH35_00290 [Candidatus Pacebacteria bacterium]|nr:hypothetical protein [Candidatus Paceibacterota bacterium]
MENQMLIQVVANVRIEINVNNFLVDDKDFVRFVIQSTGGGVRVGHNFFISDYRLTTLQAAKAINPEDSWEDIYKAKNTLIKAVWQPAKVVVMEKKDGDKKFYYINFYPANGQKPEALFSKTSYYIGKYSLEFSIEKDESLWSWWIWIEENSDGDYQAGYGIEKDGSIWGWQNETEESFPQKPKTSRCWNRELVLLTLTDDMHKVVVRRHEPIKLGHSKKNLVVIGTDILYR